MKDKEKDLENTKPIEILSELSISREEKYERLDDELMPRSEKYKDAVMKEEAKEQAELAEEALAEKNIAEAEKLLEEKGALVQYHVLGRGTASGELRDILGLGEIEKSVIITMLSKHKADKMIIKLKNNLYLGAPNTGIAFTVPLTSASAHVVRYFAEEEETDKTERNEKMGNNYSMIMAFVNSGYSEEVMAAAKPVGAGGGTVFHSRRVDNKDSVHLFGISVQEEREIVLIIAENDKKKDIMKAIMEKCGSESGANGSVISLPVDSLTIGVPTISTGSQCNGPPWFIKSRYSTTAPVT